VRLEQVQARIAEQRRQLGEARHDVEHVGPDRFGMSWEHLAQHEVDDQERTRRGERDQVREAARELLAVARVVQHGAQRGHDRERPLRGECLRVARVEDVRALEPAGERGMARRRGREQLRLDVGHEHVVAALERGGGQVAHAAAELEPARAELELLTVAGERRPEIEGRRRQIRGDLVGGDREIIVLDLAPASRLLHQLG